MLHGCSPIDINLAVSFVKLSKIYFSACVQDQAVQFHSKLLYVVPFTGRDKVVWGSRPPAYIALLLYIDERILHLSFYPCCF